MTFSNNLNKTEIGLQFDMHDWSPSCTRILQLSI